ncbi:MAG: hypothetical protein K6G87_04735 [Butyrivibrio sp.]|uniref:hypothetical protein n=1 Tax=Butyrivibrio sp. TaxID=28121 RepID=UPI0025D84A6B|nr:hypothetical protein [Butyrivibrio sp.]MCR5770526.1 hypothetical protein [Butyrivibrio sp.]
MESRVGVIKQSAAKARVLVLERIGKYEIAIGVCLCAYGIINLVCDITYRWVRYDLNDMIMEGLLIALSAIIGLFGIGSGTHHLYSIRHFRRYIGFLQHDETGSVRRLADSTGEPYDETLDRIHRYADRGYFGNIIIDDASGRISFPDRIRKYSDQGYRTVTCSCCGATRSLPDNTIVKCEYCGNVIDTTNK